MKFVIVTIFLILHISRAEKLPKVFKDSIDVDGQNVTIPSVTIVNGEDTTTEEISTTPSNNVTTTMAPSTTTNSSSTPNPTTTSVRPPTSSPSPSPKPSPTNNPEPQPTVSPTTAPTNNRRFDGPSFIGGIVLALGLVAIGFVAFKFYKARTELNYHTL